MLVAVAVAVVAAGEGQSAEVAEGPWEAVVAEDRLAEVDTPCLALAVALAHRQ